MEAEVRRFSELVSLLEELPECAGRPIRIFPIGAQGAGKSTLGSRLAGALPGLQVISLDQMRLDLYQARHPNEPVDYRSLKSFLTGRRESAIRRLALRTFLECDAPFAYLDRMNLTVGSRAPFIEKTNFNVAVVLKPEVETLLERHRSRADKAEAIPAWVVVGGHRRLEPPEEGEFDLVIHYRIGEEGARR